jgi:diamine N-acetyltransferase
VAMVIRKAVSGDYDALCELIDQVDAIHRNKLPWMYQKPEGPVRDKKLIDDLIANETIGLFVAEIDGLLLGFIHAAVREAPAYSVFRQRRYVLIDNIAVKEGAQHKGIGRALMKTACQWAAEKGATAVDLHVYYFNEEAVSFYRNLGFDSVRLFMSKSLKENDPL